MLSRVSTRDGQVISSLSRSELGGVSFGPLTTSTETSAVCSLDLSLDGGRARLEVAGPPPGVSSSLTPHSSLWRAFPFHTGECGQFRNRLFPGLNPRSTESRPVIRSLKRTVPPQFRVEGLDE
jgi:hypothetical protein